MTSAVRALPVTSTLLMRANLKPYNAEISLVHSQMNQKIGSCLFHQKKQSPLPEKNEKTEFLLLSHQTVAVVRLQQ